MSRSPNDDSFRECLDAFNPSRFEITRSLALYSAAITRSDEGYLRETTRTCVAHGAAPEQLYEVVLQSYLFLGFPRMLQAADSLVKEIPALRASHRPADLNGDDPSGWLKRGRELCRRVYDSSYEALKRRVTGLAPEVFLWMELEGYGKVLSRPGLDIVDRELAIVACLMLENRAPQLYSHLRGALNVGASPELVGDVLSDLVPTAAEGYATALAILDRLEVT